MEKINIIFIALISISILGMGYSETQYREDMQDRLYDVQKKFYIMNENLDSIMIVQQDIIYDKDIEINLMTEELINVVNENVNLKNELQNNKIQFYDTYELKIRPTYKEVMDFIEKDNTDEIVYREHKFDCTQFSNLVIRNAISSGIFACAVDIGLDTDSDNVIDRGHMIIAFNTIDKGIIYIEPQFDIVVDMEINMNYWCSVNDNNKCNPLYVKHYDSCFESVIY